MGGTVASDQQVSIKRKKVSPDVGVEEEGYLSPTLGDARRNTQVQARKNLFNLIKPIATVAGATSRRGEEGEKEISNDSGEGG